MLYTGYFANTKKYMKSGLIPVSIARFTPSFFKDKVWIVFAPSVDMLERYKKGQLSIENYREEYEELLERRITEKMLSKLETACSNKDYVMLCYEKPSDFCHRQILAEWLTKRTNMLVKEYAF